MGEFHLKCEDTKPKDKSCGVRTEKKQAGISSQGPSWKGAWGARRAGEVAVLSMTSAQHQGN